MPSEVVFSNNLLSLLLLLGILGLISIFLLKFYNILKAAEIYDIQMSIITLAIGSIAFVFVEIGTFLTFFSATEAILIEYAIYLWFARIFIIMIWLFWFAELIFYAGKITIEPLKRMQKRRNDRINNHRTF